jgi:hypothetical protein
VTGTAPEEPREPDELRELLDRERIRAVGHHSEAFFGE